MLNTAMIKKPVFMDRLLWYNGSHKGGTFMYYIFPDYINEFKCTADMCPDTCCAGWKICVDRDSLKRYGKTRGRYLLKIIKSVDFAGRTFRHKEGKRCAFLRDDGLCDMYLNMGEDALCRTCRNYSCQIACRFF